mgnify:CR=1 FL=1
MAKVAVEKEGATTIVSIDRFAEARNAVDPETAILLREAVSMMRAPTLRSRKRIVPNSALASFASLGMALRIAHISQ